MKTLVMDSVLSSHSSLSPSLPVKLPDGISEAIKTLRKFKVTIFDTSYEEKIMEIQAANETEVRDCLLEMPDVEDFQIEEVIVEAKLDKDSKKT